MNLIDYLKQCKEKQIKKAEADIHHFNKKINDASTQKMFEKLSAGVITLPYLSQQQKTEMQRELKKLQKIMDDISSKQCAFNIHINKYADTQSKKTFTSALELQHAGQQLLLSTFCNHKTQLQTFLTKYNNLISYIPFWENAQQLESKYNPIDIDFNLIQSMLDELQFNYTNMKKEQEKNKKLHKVASIQTNPNQQEVIYKEKEVIKEIYKDNPQQQLQIDELKKQITKLKEEISNLKTQNQLLQAHELTYGLNCMQDIQAGIQMYIQIGTADSKNSLAQLYQQGKMIAQNIKLARQIYKANIKTNNLQSIFQYGKIELINKKKIQKGIQYIKQAADQGHIEACLDLAILYYQGVQQNNEFLFQKNQQLAKQYANKGQHTSRGMCDLGIIETDSLKSINYLNEAIKKEYTPAFYYLGLHYLQDQEKEKGLSLLLQGALNQDLRCVEELYQYLYEDSLNSNSLNKFQDYLQLLAVTKQSSEAFYYLGLCNNNNLLLQQTYYQLGSKLNNQKCLDKLSEINKDVQIYSQIVEMGQNQALFQLGQHYEQQGKYLNAIDYYKQSKSQQSYNRISQIYQSQLKNDALAKEYEQLAFVSPRFDSESEIAQSLIITQSKS
ncbi:unnamed protein product [Paramecium octaurelia]|uniref:Uncharacterized protein n=1 Tax=Paramecium octaurelia TaxID=43137 RepID=A0A8S1YDQ7_PAROT|nr:unnamed protein product [Paramecium octaurelia]